MSLKIWSFISVMIRENRISKYLNNKFVRINSSKDFIFCMKFSNSFLIIKGNQRAIF